MMNNPEIIQASMFLAKDMLATFDTEDERIENMFQKATSRKPKPAELEQLNSYLIEQKAHFENNGDAAKEYLSVGELNEEDFETAPELAAYTLLATVIFNLDESLTRS